MAVVAALPGAASVGTMGDSACAALKSGTKSGMILNTVLQLLWILNAIAMLFVLILTAGFINELIKVLEKYNEHLDSMWWTKK